MRPEPASAAHRLRDTLALTLALASVAFHLGLVFSGLVPNLVSRPIHLGLALPWVYFLAAPGPRGAARVCAIATGLVGIALCAWIVLEREALDEQYGTLAGVHQEALAWLLVLIVLDMARRTIRWALPIVASAALAYGLLGQHVPGEFGHPGVPLASLLGTLTIAEGGIWGPLTGVSVNVVAVFVLLGAFVGAGHGGTSFMSLSTWLAGGLRAGAAKVSVVASALFGSISGSASANVASTGAFTLPAMERLGYPRSLAAAVEAVASSGGQIMPPLMGAGAFVMVELLGVSYEQIMIAAALPALLFFWCAWIGVDHYARRLDLRPMPLEERPAAATVLRLLPFFVLPFAVLLVGLFARQLSAQYAAAIAILAAIAMLYVDERGRLTGSGWHRLARGSVAGARQIAGIAAIIACAGIVIGTLNVTGLGLKITSVIIGLSGGQLWPALLLTAIACLVLGMEVPTTAAYVICVAVAGPALEHLGLPALHVHLFVFWYALLSTITPPVCGAVFIAAGMAQTPWVPVSLTAMRLGLGLYLVPLAFIANPALVEPLAHPLATLLALARTGAALWLVTAALIPCGDPLWRRVLAAALGLALVFAFPGT